MSATHDRLSIEVPAEPEAVGSARLFAASVARLTGIDDEIVEDVRLAISEAVTDRIRAVVDGGEHASSICVTANVHEKHVEFEVTGGAEPGSDNGELGLAVIQSLFPDAIVDASPPRLRFSAPMSARPGGAGDGKTLGKNADQGAGRGA